MSNSKTLEKNFPTDTNSSLPADFSLWHDTDMILEPITLSPDRIQQLDSTPILSRDNDGSIRLHPKTVQDVTDILTLARQRKQSISLNTKHNASLSIDITQLKNIREIHFKDTAITVETGITWGELQRHLSQYGRWIPLSYPPKLTLLEIIANDYPCLDTGTLNYPGGYPRDYIMGIELATTDGRLSKYGGLVVKNATGYDLNKLYTGSQHEFGIITSVILKIFPKPIARHTFRVPFSTPEQIWPVFEKLCSNTLPLQWFELSFCLTDNKQSALIVQFVSHYQDLANQYQQQFKQLVQQAGLSLEPIEADTIHSILPSHSSYRRIDMAYSLKFDRQQQQLQHEFFWLGIIHKCLDSCLPDWVTFSPMARTGTLVWENPVSLSLNPERNADALLALHDELYGQNPYGIPEGFLAIKGFENYSTYFHDTLKTVYDPTSVLT